MSAIITPTPRVAANRRRAFLWLPLMATGALATVAGGPMLEVFNSLDVAGAAMMLGGLLGIAREVQTDNNVKVEG